MKPGPRVSYGWWMILASALGLFLGPVPILVSSFGVFLKPLAAEFHSGRAAIALALTILNTGYAVGTVLAGRLADRFGARRVILPAMIATGVILLFSYLGTAALWQFYAFFLLAGLASAGAGPVLFAHVISHWFDRRRGLALGCMLLGMGGGATVMPTVAQWLIAGFGWRFAYSVVGAAILAITVPVIAVALKEKPADIGLAADPLSEPGQSLREALRTPTFWLLLLVVVIVSCSLHACAGHLPAMLTDRGTSAKAAALASSLFGAGTLAGRAISGYLLDRFFAPRIGAVIFGCGAAGIALLGLTSAPGLAYAAALLMGLGWGTEGDVKAYLVSRYFGLRFFGSIFGVIFCGFVLGVALGGYLMGVVFDTNHSYGMGIGVAFLGMLLSAMLMLLLKPHRYGAKDEAETGRHLHTEPASSVS